MNERNRVMHCVDYDMNERMESSRCRVDGATLRAPRWVGRLSTDGLQPDLHVQRQQRRAEGAAVECVSALDAFSAAPPCVPVAVWVS